MIRLLNYDDKDRYLSLLATFRKVNITMTDLEFRNIYDKININSKIFIVVIDDVIVGSATVLFEQKFINNNALYAHIEDVVILPKARGNGVCKNLINYIVEICKDYGVKKIVLNCDERLEQLYGKCNFTKNGTSMNIVI